MRAHQPPHPLTPDQHNEIAQLPEFKEIEGLIRDFPSLFAEKGNAEVRALQSALLGELRKEENKWLVAVMREEAALPRKYEIYSHHTAAMLFSAVCAAILIPFYIEGGKDDGLEYQIGGITVNVVQNLLYGCVTYYFFKNPGDLINRNSSFLLGLLATGATALAAFKMTGSIGTTVLTAIGNLPINIYGMSDSVKRGRDGKSDLLKFCRRDNSSADNRKELSAKLQAVAQRLGSPEIQKEVKEEKKSNAENNAIAVLGVMAGLGLGIILAGGMAGYIYSGVLAAEEFAGNLGAWVITALSNTPSVLIALCISGFDVAKAMVNKAAEGVRFLAGNTEASITSRQARFLALNIGLTAAVGYAALYSDATSRKLAKEIPAIQPFVDGLLGFCISKGAILFNGIMSAKAINSMVDYLQVAYQASPIEVAKSQFGKVKDWITSASSNDIAKHCQKFGLYSAPAAPAPASSADSLAALGHKIADEYVELAEQDLAQVARDDRQARRVGSPV